MKVTITNEQPQSGFWIVRVYLADRSRVIGIVSAWDPIAAVQLALDQMRAMGLEWDGLIHEHGTYC